MIIAKPKILQQILDDIDNMEPSLFPPPWPIKMGEQKIAVAREYTQKVWSLLKMLERDINHLRTDLNYLFEEEAQRAKLQLIEMRSRYEVLLAVFQLCCRVDANYWDPDVSMGLRKDWQLVILSPENDNSPFSFLRNLLG